MYGAHAQRVPALGGAVLKDIDIFKVLLLGQTERGVVDGSGVPVIMDEIYSMNDFIGKCGSFDNAHMAAYVADSFYKELDKNISCEMKVLSYVDAGAVQAGYDILDSAPLKIFDADAAYKGLADKSAFGNKIAIKTTKTNNVTMKLTANVASGATAAYLDNVDNLQVGYYVKFVGEVTAMVVVTSINTSAKSIGFAALTLGQTLTVAGTVVSRADVKLEIAVKDSSGNYQRKEVWEAPFAKSNTLGLALLVNDTISGSEYLKLTVNAANTTPELTQLPADLTSWTPLTGGSDNADASDANWNTLATTYLNSTEFTIMLAPESATITHNINMLNFCTSNYKGMYYVQCSDGAAEATLKNYGASLRGSIVFGMIPSDKWLNVVDPTVIGGYKHMPKVGVDAAYWFNTYNKFGEAKVAAGNKSEMVLKCTDQLLDSNGLVHDDQDGVGSRLIKNYSVNICRYRRGKGITNNSARTLSTDAGYMYQNQIMQFLLYSRSIVTYLREVEQDKAGKSAQNSHYNAVWGYMKKKFDSGQLFIGQKEDGTETGFSDVCLIINDFSINTLADIANGIEQIFFQFVAVPPIEELILSVASAPVTSVRG